MLTATGTLPDPVEGVSPLHDASAVFVDLLAVRVVPDSSGGNPTCCPQSAGDAAENRQEAHCDALFTCPCVGPCDMQTSPSPGCSLSVNPDHVLSAIYSVAMGWIRHLGAKSCEPSNTYLAIVGVLPLLSRNRDRTRIRSYPGSTLPWLQLYWP